MSDQEHFLTPDQAIEWNEYLDSFVAEVYPLFERHGVSIDAALTCWFANRLYNRLDDDNDEDWRL